MTRFVLITASALAIGATGLIGCKRDQTAQNTNATTDTRTAGEKTRDAISNAGDKAANGIGAAVDKTKEAASNAGDKIAASTQPSPDAAVKNSRDTLAKTVEAAVSKNAVGDVVDNFTKAARDRIGKVDKGANDTYNAAVDKFRADWKAKYNQDFKLTDKEEMAFGSPIEIQPGVATGAQLASDRTTASGTTNDKSANNVTHVNFPAANGAPAVSAQLDNEGTVTSSYKLEVPSTLDGNKLRDNLTATINKLDGMKDAWPSDVDTAYRAVSQQILAAIVNNSMQ